MAFTVINYFLYLGPPTIPLSPTGVCHWRQRGDQKSEEGKEEEEGEGEGEGGGKKLS